MTPRPRPGGARRPRSTWRSATTRSPSPRRISPAPATSRSSVIGNDPAASSCTGPGEIVSGHEFYDYAAKYTAGPVRDLDPGRGEPTPAGDDPQDRARRLPGDRRRGLRPRRLPGRRRAIYLSEINTIPGFTPISLFPTMPAAGGYTFADVCARIVELALERHAARVAAASTPGGPAAMSAARRPPARPGRRSPAGRRTRPIRRASAGLSPVRAGAALAMLASAARDLRRRRLVGLRLRRRSRVEGAAFTDRGRGRGRARRAPAARTCSALDRPARGRARGAADRRAAHGSTVELPDTLAVTLDEREPILVWQVGGRRFLADATGSLFAELADEPPADAADAAGHRRPAGGLGGAVGRQRARPGRPRRGDPARPRSCPADVGSAASRAGRARHRRERLRRPRPAAGWSRSSASTRRACARRS